MQFEEEKNSLIVNEVAPTFVNSEFIVASPNTEYSEEYITSQYSYRTTKVIKSDSGGIVAIPKEDTFVFKTERKVPKTGVMLVGWAGCNGSTVTAGVIANRLGLTWQTKEKLCQADYLGSITQSATVRLGLNECGESVYVPFSQMLPLVSPNEIVIGGWDINRCNLADAMRRSQVLDYDLQRQLVKHMQPLMPLPSIYDKNFIAANQADRADNLIAGTRQQQLDELRRNIRAFKADNKLDKVIVLWTANTERFAEIVEGVNDSAANLLAAIARHKLSDEIEISPSSVFAVASILEGCSYINGSPQNTFVPGVVELAEQHNVFICGDDFKSGQTKMKSVLVDFLVSAGIKPVAIVSYNHLGNNDGKNLSAPEQFRSKEISKSNVVDDMVDSNQLLYKGGVAGSGPDHVVVIKYVPYVGDSKRALDEYTSEIFMGGKNTIVMHNTCEDSLLAAPIILDLVILCEICERISIRKLHFSNDTTNNAGNDTTIANTNGVSALAASGVVGGFERFHPILSILSYLLKAPMVPGGTPVVNALASQRQCIVNVFRACVGLPPDDCMLLEHRIPSLIQSCVTTAALHRDRIKRAEENDASKDAGIDGPKRSKKQ